MNERVRTFLRLEFLFQQVEQCLGRMTPTDMRMATGHLIDVVDLVGRTDVKNEAIKELEKYGKNLENFQSRNGVDNERLQTILEDIKYCLSELHSNKVSPGQTLRNDEFINLVKQRNNIPGGTCSFDLPSYHYWLNLEHDYHKKQFDYWMSDLLAFRDSVYLILHIIRNSTSPSNETADNGFFQKTLEPGSGCRMIRVLLSKTLPYYPEISGGKHRFTIRFMHRPDLSSRPVQVDRPINFKLYCCTL